MYIGYLPQYKEKVLNFNRLPCAVEVAKKKTLLAYIAAAAIPKVDAGFI